jgi:hypothetical protein
MNDNFKHFALKICQCAHEIGYFRADISVNVTLIVAAILVHKTYRQWPYLGA